MQSGRDRPICSNKELEDTVKKPEKDITERNQAEDKLSQYERIVAASNDHMAMIDRNYVYQAVNDAYLKSMNKAREDIIAHSVPEIFGKVRPGNQIRIFDTMNDKP
jgi:PAS domain-containing protein